MSRFVRPAKKKRRAGSGLHQVGAVMALALCLGVGVVGIDNYVAAQRAAAAAAAAARDDEIYTGSILYMPRVGDVCRQLLFDNQNGQFTDNGYVDCNRAAYQPKVNGPKQWSAARVRVISTGFRRR
jgi:hypothetical protein